jgi:predicted phosphodiesterase
MRAIRPLRERAIALCTKYQDLPSMQLARILIGDNPEEVLSLDAARSMIRGIRGQHGNSGKAVAGLERKAGSVKDNPYKLPLPQNENWTPYQLRGCKRTLIVSDVHIPYHDISAVECALDAGKEADVDSILINGDLVDFYGISSYLRDPRKRDVAGELDDCKVFLGSLRSNFPNAKIIWKLGNHDERFRIYLMAKAPELLGIKALDIENLVSADENEVEIVTNKRPIYAAGLTILHGHELKGGISAPVNVARGLFLRARACAIQGHNHQTSEHSAPDIRFKLITTYSTGCLCYLHPEYMPYNNWNHGFALLDLDGKNFRITNKRIIDGVVY